VVKSIKSIHTGYFKLDGGAMFGIVPKRMWNKLNPADDNNLCTWSMRALYIETDSKHILVDTGLGNKQDDKFRSHFEPFGAENLMDSLHNDFIDPEMITDVLLTHLHFDHVGGALYKGADGKIYPTFPNARYWTNKAQYDWAMQPNPKEAASFLKENFVPLQEMGLLHYIDIEQDIEFDQGITLMFTYGHTEAMMLPIIEYQDKTIYYCADTIASSCHIGMPYVMGYDIRPLESMTEKATLLERAMTKNSFLLFEHDPLIQGATITRDERSRIIIDKPFKLNEIL
jgi:glyoxylase-like metal-dependent hydrolase (beta-lactamase superfamily II)